MHPNVPHRSVYPGSTMRRNGTAMLRRGITQSLHAAPEGKPFEAIRFSPGDLFRLPVSGILPTVPYGKTIGEYVRG